LDSYFIGVGLVIDNHWIRLELLLKMNIKLFIMVNIKCKPKLFDRTQPPLYSSLLLGIAQDKKISQEWLQKHLETVILE
jgi:alpha,alpha-trehalase